MKALTFHTDPGHGWLEVPLQDLIDLKIANDISRYSYRSSQNVIYLEKDMDAPRYLNELKKNNIRYTVKENTNGNFIRNMKSFSMVDILMGN